jgi:hypothetical protein
MRNSTKMVIAALIIIIAFTVFDYFGEDVDEEAIKKEYEENKKTISGDYMSVFSFYIDDTKEVINGEIIIDDKVIGRTSNGNFSMPHLDAVPNRFILKGEYEEKPFEFAFNFPRDYENYDYLPFIVSREALNKPLKKGDEFSQVNESHWGHMPVSYRLVNEDVCGSGEAYRIRKAFFNIENETNGTVSFEEVEEYEDITITCHAGFDKSLMEDGKITTATTTPYGIGNLIEKASIDFYDTKEGKIASNCGRYPDVEVHEILHAFGFGHVDDRYNIMSPTQLYCPTRINDNIIEKLVEIYG